ncbi:MAG: TonB-dependent receptor [Cytophagales bacterium]|nr:TonB-dependent receptor [Cytophagales bacterium]
MRKTLLLSFVLVLAVTVGVHTVAYAQDVATVSGRVTSSDDNTPLPGVSVVVKGTATGTTTGSDGRYSIQVPANATLVFSFIGHTTEEVAVNGRSTVNMTLVQDVKSLSEVIVVGYGGEMSKSSFTGAASKVKGDAIQNMPVQSIDRGLQARASGVFVQSANGQPGGIVQIRIRGTGSISAGNEPLYVVDGVQINNAAGNTAFTSTNPLNFLNPNDIESIEILKDAAAAAIYGSQASNGVVLITTKRGKAGKTQLTFNVYGGVVQPIRLLDVLNTQEWIQVRTEALRNQDPRLTLEQARASVLGSIRLNRDFTQRQIDSLPTYDWQRAAFRQGRTSNYEFSLTGGNDKTTFYWSGSYNTSDANVIAIDFKRGTSTFKLSHKVNEKLTIEPSVILSTTIQRGPFGGPTGGSFLGSAAFSAPLMLPMNPIYNPDGSFFGTPATGGTAGILNQNVIQVSEQNKIRNRLNQMVGNLSFNYRITNALSFKWVVGLDYRNSLGNNFQDPRTADAFNVRGRVSTERTENINFNSNAVLNYNKTFGKHTVGGLLGAEYRRDYYEEVFSVGEGVATPALQTPATTANPITVTGFETEFRRAGAFAQAKYEYDGRYIVSALARYDGSSRFGSNNFYGVFPSVSGAWVISEESFLKGSGAARVVNFLKLRASYGTTGNDQIGNFDSRGLFGTTGIAYNGVPGLSTSNLANPNLRWEKSTTTDFGLDVGLFSDRITLTADWFNRLSTDLLLTQAVPNTAGYDEISRNTGQMYNRGWEFELNTVNVKAGDFSWATNFNFTYIDNKVTRLYDGIRPIGRDSLVILPGNTGVIVGYPIGSIFTSQYAGVNPATGRPMWYDASNNPTYLPLNPTDFRVVGDGFAEIYGGLNNAFQYKGLELSVLFQYEFGRKAVNGQSQFMSENGGRLFNSFRMFYDRRWQNPGDITDVPRPINGNAETRGGGATGGSRFVEDASFIRLKQVNFSYKLPQSWVQFVKLRDVKIYAQALNLITWTRWSGFDAEFINLGSGNNGAVPLSRVYTVGVQLGL